MGDAQVAKTVNVPINFVKKIRQELNKNSKK